ncbi:MAG TPA: FecR domain-containing protein [Puia sp.]|nr:FecR domain-containing protein [Puia sp.]
MDPNYLDELIRKYADDTATPEEIQELLEWYRSIHSFEIIEWPATYPTEKEDLEQRLLQRLDRQLNAPASQPPSTVPSAPAPWPMTAVPPAAAPRPIDTPYPRPLPLPRIYHRPWFRVAASLILIVSAWILWNSLRPHETAWLSLHNPSGKIQAIRLPDSSQVWLNAASSLRYAQNFHQQREIYLEGEAYFDVTEDKAHPFTVHAGELTTTVLGTSFDIKSFADESSHSVTVIRGKVAVAHDGKILDQLTAARQLQWDNRNSRSQTVSVDTSQVMGWQQGWLLFRGQPLEEIAASLGHWYNVQFEFSDSVLRRCRYYIKIKNTTPLEETLSTISALNNMKFTIDTTRRLVTLSGKRC